MTFWLKLPLKWPDIDWHDKHKHHDHHWHHPWPGKDDKDDKDEDCEVPCFTPGTRIQTNRGMVPVETLRVGDRVVTRDNGHQEIRWIGATELSAASVLLRPELRPIRIAAGCLGDGLPLRDMWVSPQHRILFRRGSASVHFSDSEVLVPARHATRWPGIETETFVPGVTYIHMMFDHHQLVLSEGAWTESFQPGDHMMNGMSTHQREEIFGIFPDLEAGRLAEVYPSARRTLRSHEAELLARL